MVESEMNFNEKCYELLRKVPGGKVTTYKALAKAINTKAYRAVGNAMRNNKHPEKIPCYKVVKSNGEVGGYMGNYKNINQKINKLKADRIVIENNRVNLDKYLHKL